MKTPKTCPECGEECKEKSCSCGWKRDTAKYSQEERKQYDRFCQEVRDFFLTDKGKDLKAIQDAKSEDISSAIRRGMEAIKMLKSVQAGWADGDCACEAGIIFYHKNYRYKVGRCDICRDPQKPENFYSVKKWDSR